MYHGVLLWGASAQEAPTKDIQHDYRRGFIKFLSHESDLPGHVYNAVEVAADHGIHHILDDVARLITPKNYADYMLARAFASPTLERAKYVFNDLIKSAFDPDLLPRELETAAAAARFDLWRGYSLISLLTCSSKGTAVPISNHARQGVTRVCCSVVPPGTRVFQNQTNPNCCCSSFCCLFGQSTEVHVSRRPRQ